MSQEQKQQFIVNRNGSLDQEWLNNLQRQERLEAIQQVGKQAVSGTGRAVKRIGMAVFNGLDEFVTSV